MSDKTEPPAPPYLCPDGSNPCGEYGYCLWCPHDDGEESEGGAE